MPNCLIYTRWNKKHCLKTILTKKCTKKKEKETEAIESRVNPTSNKPANTAYWQGLGWPYMHVCQLPMKVIQSNVRLTLLYFSYNNASKWDMPPSSFNPVVLSHGDGHAYLAWALQCSMTDLKNNFCFRDHPFKRRRQIFKIFDPSPPKKIPTS